MMRSFFGLMAAAALLTFSGTPARAQAAPAPEIPSDPEAMPAELRIAVETMRNTLFAPGERVEGWDVGGVDPDSDLRAAGVQQHVFRITYRQGPSVVLLTDRPISAFAPLEWRVVDTYGSATTRLANPFVQFDSLSPRYVMAIRANSARRASVDCVDPINNAVLYEIMDAPESEGDEDLPLIFRLALLAGEEQIVCARYDGTREAGYRGRSFLPDGRSLPQLDDADARITIVPAAPIERLLTR